MPDASRIELFVEDVAHERFVQAVIRVVAHAEGRAVHVVERSARGGRPRVLDELKLYQQTLLVGALPLPQLIVAAIDANCARYAAAVARIRNVLMPEILGRTIVACPDPHIEKWFFADPEAFARTVGLGFLVKQRKCVRDYYKDALRNAVVKAGHPAPLGGIEFAEEIVWEFDFNRATMNDRSLKHFVDDLRAFFRQMPMQ